MFRLLQVVTPGVAILATSQDLDLKTSKVGSDYFVRVRDVIERINRRQNVAESTAADRYRRAISKPDFLFQPKNRLAHSSPKLGSPKIDLSWKDGGKRFPKKSSSIGEDFQVSLIPAAANFRDIECAESAI